MSLKSNVDLVYHRWRIKLLVCLTLFYFCSKLKTTVDYEIKVFKCCKFEIISYFEDKLSFCSWFLLTNLKDGVLLSKQGKITWFKVFYLINSLYV